MKSILYVGATLMIGASIYGFVDYKKASHNKKFTGMYESKEIKEPVIEKKEPAAAMEDVKPVQAEKKVAKKTEPQKFSVAKKSSEVPAADKLENEPVVATTTTLKESKLTEKYKKAKKRKLNTKLFSRAPLREEIEIAETRPQKETKKAAAKEY
ncbi:MAG TPA: hypothetical protein VF476_14440 [Chitinophagaceae bacterium]